jgi:hypothetical protein
VAWRWRALSAASTFRRAKGTMESNGKPRLGAEFARVTFLLTGCPKQQPYRRTRLKRVAAERAAGKDADAIVASLVAAGSYQWTRLKDTCHAQAMSRLRS